MEADLLFPTNYVEEHVVQGVSKRMYDGKIILIWAYREWWLLYMILGTLK